MTNLEAVLIVEGETDNDDSDKYVAAWQHLIDTGLVWSLQGSFGRQAMRMIQSGHCKPQKN